MNILNALKQEQTKLMGKLERIKARMVKILAVPAAHA
jgi:hypothetical protein